MIYNLFIPGSSPCFEAYFVWYLYRHYSCLLISVSWCIFFHLFTFWLSLCLYLKFTQHVVCSFFIIQSNNLCFLMYRPFIFTILDLCIATCFQLLPSLLYSYFSFYCLCLYKLNISYYFIFLYYWLINYTFLSYFSNG